MTAVRTLADLTGTFATRRGVLLRDSLLVIAGSMLVAICAKIQAPTGPVPMTLQPFAVLLVAAALGSRRGALAMLAYLAQGAVGLPVFALPPYSGLAYLFGPTAGFLLGFVPAAYVVGLLSERGWDRRFLSAIAAMSIGQVIILAMGFFWLSIGQGTSQAFATAVAPFLLGDVFKILLAASALPLVWRWVRDPQSSSR